MKYYYKNKKMWDMPYLSIFDNFKYSKAVLLVREGATEGYVMIEELNDYMSSRYRDIYIHHSSTNDSIQLIPLL